MVTSKRIDEIILFSRITKELVKTKNEEELIAVDVACDHGFIGESLLKNKIVNKVIFSDISAKSLKKAQDLMRNQYNFADFEFKIGDGLTVLKSNVFLSVIAGIGGREIVKILSQQQSRFSKFLILQTSQDDVFVRDSLSGMGFFILMDKMVFENNHIYHTFLITREKIYDESRLIVESLKNFGYINHNITADEWKYFDSFGSSFFGKSNLLIDTKEHIEMLLWLKNRLLDNIKNNEKTINRSQSFDKYINIQKEKVVLLDNIMSWVI